MSEAAHAGLRRNRNNASRSESLGESAENGASGEEKAMKGPLNNSQAKDEIEQVGKSVILRAIRQVR